MTAPNTLPDPVRPAGTQRPNEPVIPVETGTQRLNEPVIPAETGAQRLREPGPAPAHSAQAPRDPGSPPLCDGVRDDGLGTRLPHTVIPTETGTQRQREPVIPVETGTQRLSEPVIPAETGAQRLREPGSPHAPSLRRRIIACSVSAVFALLALGLLIFLIGPSDALAQQMPTQGLPAITAEPTAGGGQIYSLSVQTLLLLTMLTFLPAMLLLMTSFTRIIIVLSLLRTAMGTAATPPNQVLVALALFLTLFAMSPVFDRVYEDAYQPLAAGDIAFETALERGAVPFHEFMMAQTRETDLRLFAELAGISEFDTPSDVPLRLLVPAFVTSELKTAFQIGFTIFIPFLIIDLVVASVLMSLGMMMVPPVTISLPFKLMLFVLADGWNLLLGSLAASFFTA